MAQYEWREEYLALKKQDWGMDTPNSAALVKRMNRQIHEQVYRGMYYEPRRVVPYVQDSLEKVTRIHDRKPHKRTSTLEMVTFIIELEKWYKRSEVDNVCIRDYLYFTAPSDPNNRDREEFERILKKQAVHLFAKIVIELLTNGEEPDYLTYHEDSYICENIVVPECVTCCIFGGKKGVTLHGYDIRNVIREEAEYNANLRIPVLPVRESC